MNAVQLDHGGRALAAGRAIYLEAAAQPPSLRDAYVTQACGDDCEVRTEVERRFGAVPEEFQRR